MDPYINPGHLALFSSFANLINVPRQWTIIHHAHFLFIYLCIYVLPSFDWLVGLAQFNYQKTFDNSSLRIYVAVCQLHNCQLCIDHCSYVIIIKNNSFIQSNALYWPSVCLTNVCFKKGRVSNRVKNQFSASVQHQYVSAWTSCVVVTNCLGFFPKVALGCLPLTWHCFLLFILEHKDNLWNSYWQPLRAWLFIWDSLWHGSDFSLLLTRSSRWVKATAVSRI